MIAAKDYKLVEVESSIVVPFQWCDAPGPRSLGRAEFVCCLRFFRGKITEFWVTPQQTHLKERWHYTGPVMDFSACSYHGLDDPKVWLAVWCKEHKAVALSVYSPSDSNFIRICSYGIQFLRTGMR